MKRKEVGKQIKEEDVGRALNTFFNDKYEIYNEVSLSGGASQRADLVLVKDNERSVIEIKTSATLKVLEQAYNWKNYVNKVYVCVPESLSYKRNSTYKFFKVLCKKLNIGIIRYTYFDWSDSYNFVIQSHPLYEDAKIPQHLKLYEEQKDFVGGSATNDFITPFKITMKRVDAYLEEHGESPLNDVLKNIEHHYSNDKSGVGAIKKLIETIRNK